MVQLVVWVKKKDRISASISACNILQNNFNDYGSIWVRKSGIAEFKLKKIKSFDTDRSVILFPYLEINTTNWKTIA